MNKLYPGVYVIECYHFFRFLSSKQEISWRLPYVQYIKTFIVN